MDAKIDTYKVLLEFTNEQLPTFWNAKVQGRMPDMCLTAHIEDVDCHDETPRSQLRASPRDPNLY